MANLDLEFLVKAKTSEKFEEKPEQGRRMLKNDLNKLAFTEFTLSIDVSKRSGKIAFGILKGCKTKDYEVGMQA